MPRGRKRKNTENPLLTALEFIKLAQKQSSALEQTHCRMQNYTVVASNSIVSAGCQIAEDINACPNTFMLADALANAPSSAAISLLSDAPPRLSVRSEDFHAIVPCAESLPTIYPDGATSLVSEALRDALAVAGVLALDGAEKVVLASVRVENGSVLSTNGTAIIQAWHGAQTPYMIVPKTFITALQKVKKPLHRIGGSDNSFTIWFEDGSWIKSALYPSNTELPNVLSVLDTPAQCIPVPKGFFDTVRRLQPFSDDGIVYLSSDGMRVTSEKAYAIDAFKNLPTGISFSIANLLQIEPFAKNIHFNAKHGITIFNNGEAIRGAIINQVHG